MNKILIPLIIILGILCAYLYASGVERSASVEKNKCNECVEKYCK